MFDFVRKHTKVMQLLLFILIVPSFVLFGLEGYSRMQEKGAAVAKVDGVEITQQQWDEAHKVEAERLRAQMPNLDAKLLDSPQARYVTLERVVRERVLAAAAAKYHLVATDQRLQRDLQRDPTLAALRRADGSFDVERYKQLLAQQNMTPQMFENRIRNEISIRQVLLGVTASSAAPASVADVSLGSYFEKREAQVARFPTADFKAKVNPTDAELEAYYQAHPQQFQAPEQAAIEYVTLDLAAIEKGIAVNEADLKTYFEQNQAQKAKQEERRASHILVAVPANAPAADKEKAKARAEALLAQVKKAPDSFADVAKKNSDHEETKAKGGDLDFFSRNALPKPFEDAAFAMKKGDIAGPVETELGYHIIRLTDIKVPKVQTFEEARPQLEAELRKQQAQRKYAEAAVDFSNAVYEQSDSLKPVADKLKLEIKTATISSRKPAPGATGALASERFLQSLFAPESVERKRNTEAVEVGPNQMVSGRVTQYTPAKTRPFAEVKDLVRERLVTERAAELARKEGQEKLAAWKAKPDSATLSAAAPVSRQDQDKPRELVDAVLRVDPSAMPSFVGVDLGAEGYAVVKVNKVLPRDATAPELAKQQTGQYTQAWSGAETIAYYNLLKERFKASILVPKPAELQVQ